MTEADWERLWPKIQHFKTYQNSLVMGLKNAQKIADVDNADFPLAFTTQIPSYSPQPPDTRRRRPATITPLDTPQLLKSLTIIHHTGPSYSFIQIKGKSLNLYTL